MAPACPLLVTAALSSGLLAASQGVGAHDSGASDTFTPMQYGTVDTDMLVEGFVSVCGALGRGLPHSRAALEQLEHWRETKPNAYAYAHNEELLSAQLASTESPELNREFAVLQISEIHLPDAHQTKCYVTNFVDATGADDLTALRKFPGVTGSVKSGPFWRHGLAYSAAFSGSDADGRLHILTGSSTYNNIYLELEIWDARPE
ncbi:MAG: hypothetical protein DBW63_10210 [Hyphomonas sp.]|nr:MAG: hypothetical protein DBW63_10210 [Hyphomonas sp.]